MRGILLAKFTSFIRNPLLFLMFTGMSILFALFIGNSGSMSQITVPIYGEEQIQQGEIGRELAENEVYAFEWVEEAALYENVSTGKAEAGILLDDDGFEMIVGVASSNVQLIKQTVSAVYEEMYRNEQLVLVADLATAEEEEKLLQELNELEQEPVFEVNSQSFHGSEAFIFNQQTHSLFGFTLFFVIYTIFYSVLPILIEKKAGIWDRMILSPLKKWEMYVANLLYTFFEGYLQVVIIFTVFRYIVGIDFNGKFMMALLILIPYIFAIIALAILVTALVKNMSVFNAVLPILSVSMAMIGGAFWPNEIVQSKILLALAKVNPLTYGMEALNGLLIYNEPLSELLMPISILILMGVVFMGVGIHLMERRHV